MTSQQWHEALDDGVRTDLELGAHYAVDVFTAVLADMEALERRVTVLEQLAGELVQTEHKHRAVIEGIKQELRKV